MNKYYLEHKVEIIARVLKWKAENPDRYREIQRKAIRKYYKKNRIKMLAKNRVWVKNNLERRRTIARESARRMRVIS